MTREITMRLHDTHVGIWQDDANDPTFRSEAEAEARRVPHILVAIAPDGRRISFGEGA